MQQIEQHPSFDQGRNRSGECQPAHAPLDSQVGSIDQYQTESDLENKLGHTDGDWRSSILEGVKGAGKYLDGGMAGQTDSEKCQWNCCKLGIIEAIATMFKQRLDNREAEDDQANTGRDEHEQDTAQRFHDDTTCSVHSSSGD